MKRIRIEIGVLRDGPGMVALGLAELLRKSAALAAALPGRQDRRQLDVRLVGETRSVTVADGYRLSCDATFGASSRPNLVIVPAVDARETERLDANRKAAAWVRRAHADGADVASVCTGAFVLAEAGLLERRRATTHWAFQATLARRFPGIRLEPQAVIVDEGKICTAGGATSFINLALYLVERLLGPAAAAAASKMYLIDVNKAPQGAYAVFSPQKLHGDDAILTAQAHIERELARADSLSDIARRFAMSPRTFARRFKQATGNTPIEYVQRARIEAAKRSLEASRHSIATVASQVGYRDVVAFRKVFARYTGLTPGDYRQRYGSYTPPGTVRARRAPRSEKSERIGTPAPIRPR
jgi:transcriptional regulator GlxA family with amidase domain